MNGDRAAAQPALTQHVTEIRSVSIDVSS